MSDLNLNKNANDSIPETRNINVKNILKALSIIILIIIFIFLIIKKIQSKPKIEDAPPKTEDTSISQTKSDISAGLPDGYDKLKFDPPKPEPKPEPEPIKETPVQQITVIQPEKPKELTEEEKYQLQKAQLRRQMADQARISGFKKSGKNTQGSSSTTNAGTNRDPNAVLAQMMANQNDPNETAQKKDFAKQNIDGNFILPNTLIDSISRYEIKAGTLIPVIMSSYAESGNPGHIVAVIREDVYDTLNGKYRLIPKGSKLLGEYNSDVSFGQERLQIVFTRLTLPNGKSITLGSMVGGDGQGRSGIKDKVNTHMGKVFMSVFMSAILGAGSAIVTGNNADDNSWQAQAGQGAGEQMLAVGNKYADKVLNTDPTLLIRAGTRATLTVDKDIILEPYNSKQHFLNEK